MNLILLNVGEHHFSLTRFSSLTEIMIRNHLGVISTVERWDMGFCFLNREMILFGLVHGYKHSSGNSLLDYVVLWQGIGRITRVKQNHAYVDGDNCQ